MARAHRLGKRVQGKHFNKRPIIVNLRDYGDISYVMSKVSRLKDHPGYSVDYDYPKEIQSARSRLWPLLKKHRAEYPRSKVAIVFPAKLIADGRLIQDEFPNWNFYVGYDRMTHINVINQNEQVQQTHAQQPVFTNVVPEQRAEMNTSTINPPPGFPPGYAPLMIRQQIPLTDNVGPNNYNSKSGFQQNNTYIHDMDSPLASTNYSPGLSVVSNVENTGFAQLLNLQSVQVSDGSLNRADQTDKVVNSEYVHGSYFGTMPSLLKDTCALLLPNTTPASGSINTHSPVVSEQNQCNISENNAPLNDQTYAKVVTGSGSHVSRTRNRTSRRTYSASPYSRNLTAVKNGNFPVSKNRNETNDGQQSEPEVKK
ncbi:hypothetical protein DPMN_108931 [Dreissena polymorpha]|uniref:Uncharacterized protein n=1 Tax=Dreissena polymorpha TaxID=45954 RepID=A0A9D4QMH3_DREPO|nr:hypothetical protein DPMN_108931 [Dreissena polymorpha]